MAKKGCKYGRRSKGRCPGKIKVTRHKRGSTKLGRAMHQCKGDPNFKRCVNVEMGFGSYRRRRR
jgi:hypothetical protein